MRILIFIITLALAVSALAVDTIGFHTIRVSDSITRPSNTTVYADNDAVSDTTGDAHLTFSNVVNYPSSGLPSGTIDGAKAFSSANQTTLPDLELWLFRSDVATTADNAAFAPTDAEMLTLIGVIDFAVANWNPGDTTSGAGGNAYCEVTKQGLTFHLGTSETNIYGQLRAKNAYTPVSGEVFTVELLISRD